MGQGGTLQVIDYLNVLKNEPSIGSSDFYMFIFFGQLFYILLTKLNVPLIFAIVSPLRT
jgi:hypothetical protein